MAGNPDRYGPEVLSASWNPQVTVLAEPTREGVGVPAERGTGDVASFLARFYRAQRT